MIFYRRIVIGAVLAATLLSGCGVGASPTTATPLPSVMTSPPVATPGVGYPAPEGYPAPDALATPAYPAPTSTP